MPTSRVGSGLRKMLIPTRAYSRHPLQKWSQRIMRKGDAFGRGARLQEEASIRELFPGSRTKTQSRKFLCPQAAALKLSNQWDLELLRTSVCSMPFALPISERGYLLPLSCPDSTVEGKMKGRWREDDLGFSLVGP